MELIEKPKRLPRAYVVLAMVMIIAVAVWIESLWLFPNYGAGVDEATYLLTAKGIATHLDPVYRNADPTAFVPEYLVEVRPGEFYGKYPVGYSLLAAIAYKVGGPLAPFYVNPILVPAALLGIFLLARFFLDDWLALAATFFLGVNPAVLYYGVTAMSHAADLAFAVWCLFAGYSWYVKPRWWKAALAGFLLGYAVSIRYTEALLVLPVGYLVACRLWDLRRSPAKRREGRAAWMNAGLLAVAGFAGLLPLFWYHWKAFGGVFETGYGFTGEAAAFSWQNLLHHALPAVEALWRLPFGVSLFLPLAMGGFIWGWMRGKREAAFLAFWCVPGWVAYAAYYWTVNDGPGDNWMVATGSVLYVRFFLTLFPGILLTGLMWVQAILRHRTAAEVMVAIVVVILGSVHLGFMPPMSNFEGSGGTDAAATAMVQRYLPGNAVIVSEGYAAYSLVYFTDMTVFYPRYFVASWVERELGSGERGNASGDFNPLRRERFREALGGRTGPELSELMKQRMIDYARQGRTIGLLVKKDSPRWYGVFDGTFQEKVLAVNEERGLVLMELIPLPGVAGR